MSCNVSSVTDVKDAEHVKNSMYVIPFLQTPHSMTRDSRHSILPANRAVNIGRCDSDWSAPPQIVMYSLLAKA